MASVKSKKSRTKPPRGRPTATSVISQPVVEDTSLLTALSSFSSNGNYFAFLSLAIDKHRLRVYDTTSGQSVAEHIVDSARVTTLVWSKFGSSDAQLPLPVDPSSPPTRKRRKKRTSQAADTDAPPKGVDVVVLGLSNGTLILFSPTHARAIHTLSNPTSAAAILSVVVTERGDSAPIVWTSGADGAIRLWDAQKNQMIGDWKNDNRIPYSSMAVRPGVSEDGRVDILVASHEIRLLSTKSNLSEAASFGTQKPNELAFFTGHASSITHLQWDASQKPSNRFLTMAEADRFIYIWEVPDARLHSDSSMEGKLVASIPLDSDARAISLSVSLASAASTFGRQNLLALSASGKISVFPILSELTPPASSDKTPHKVPTLIPHSNISVSSKKTPSTVHVASAVFAKEEGNIQVAKILGGVRPVFNVVVSDCPDLRDH